MNVDALKAFLTARLPDYLDLLRQMVGINSYTANREGVNRLGTLTAEVFAELGLAAAAIPAASPDHGDHRILARPDHGGRRLGLISHLDTVYSPEEEAAHDFVWRPVGPRIYGPGTVDIKGGTVIIYMMLDALRALAPDTYDRVDWTVLLDATEEVSGADFGRLCLDRLGDDAYGCLVFEGGQLAPSRRRVNVVVARKGMAIFRLSADGRAAHAGSAHDQGANAIVQLADVVRQVDGFTDYARDLTFNVGTIAGGTVVNRVPHQAAATVEMRAFDPDVFDEAVGRMLALNDYSSVASPNGYGCRVQVDLVRQTKAWPENEATGRLFDAWLAAAAGIGFRAVPERRGGLSDANHIWSRLPTLDGLGPAGGNAHCSERAEDGSKDQEFVLAGSFVPKAMINVLGVLHWVAEQEEEQRT